MPTYRVNIGKNTYLVEIRGDQFLVNGEPVPLKIRKLNEQGLVLLEKGSKQMDLLLSPFKKNQLSVISNRKQLTLSVEQGRQAKASSKEKANDMTAPMPGTITEVLVHEGEAVEKGQVIAVMESMKMQMEIRTPMQGVITKLQAMVGGRIEKGMSLAQVLPMPA